MGSKQQSEAPFVSGKANSYLPWAPRFWIGMRTGSYLRMLARGRFRIHPLRYPMTAAMFGTSLVNSPLGALQSVVFGRRVKRTDLQQPPVFVIGFWRTGTTLLHELMSLDERFGYPTTFDCFAPNHFLISRWILKPIFSLLLPRRRPMDNMSVNINLPQEDEFAMCALGAPTPYYRLAFCNEPAPFLELLNTDEADPRELARFRSALEYFCKALTARDHKQLLLKSPPHTGRIKQLVEWFPGARFVHVCRHPYEIVPSMIHTWRALYHVQGYQLCRQTDQQIMEYVNDCYQRMYGGYCAASEQLATNQLVELKYEDLVADPLEQLARIYQQLEIEGFEQMRPKVIEYLDQRKTYQVNRKQLDPLIRQDIDRTWSEYFRRFGYRADNLDSPLQSQNRQQRVSAN